MENAAKAETFTIPPWLNKELFSEILRNDLKEDVYIKDVCVDPAVAKGENYLSTLYRIIVQYKRINASDNNKCFLILKTLPVGELIQKVLSDIKGFEKELHMYKYIFPAMYNIMKSSTGKVHPLSARYLDCEKENVIVLEDLKYLGYKMANRKEGLDLDHCKATVRALARFHANSVGLYNRDSSSMDMFGEAVYVADEEKRKIMQTHLDIQISTLASKIETWSGYEHYVERIKKRTLTAADDMVEQVSAKKGSLNVLNHGDCWVNNMLFNYCPETGKVKDVRFVDFQIARFSSPALDLQYFIVTSPTDEVRFQHRMTLLEEYHDELTNSFKALNLDPNILTLQQLKDEFEEKELFGLLTACTVLCTILAEKSGVPDFSDLKVEDLEKPNIGDNVMDKTYGGRIFRHRFQQLLLHYDKKGLV